MRPVRTDSFDKGDPATAPRLSTTLTYLDHADRPRLIVTYGAGSIDIDGLDPSELTTAESIPDPEEFFIREVKPISMVGMEYGPDGTLTVRKTYDMGWAYDAEEAPPYLAEYEYAGQGGQIVYSQQPGQPLTRNVLDSFGRVSQAVSILPDLNGGQPVRQLARTDYTYDLDGNVAETTQWTRVLETGDVLDPSNAVRSRSLSWYDRQKRLTASADLGTEDSDNEWVSADPAYTYDRDLAPTWDAGTGQTDRAGLPASAQLWIYIYDEYGNQTHVIDPMGLVTAFEFSPTGRMTRKIENAGAQIEADKRITDYGHEWGRLTTLAMTRTADNGGTPGETQTSRVVYVDDDTDGPCNAEGGCDDSRKGAEVVDDDFEVVSLNNAAVKWLQLLGDQEANGDPAHPDLTLRYTFGAQVAERIDARGLSFRDHDNALGLIDSIEVGHYDSDGNQETDDYEASLWIAGYPASMDAPNGESPADRVGYLDYTYDQAGRLVGVDTYDVEGGTPITHNQYDYDPAGRGDLVADWQAQGAAINQSTPHTTYAWDLAPTDPDSPPTQPGHHRLATMGYPTHDGSAARTITLSYGDAMDPYGALSRVGAISDSFASVPFIAEFEYAGVGRRWKTTLAGGEIAQSFRISSETGLAGLDMFGRTRQLTFTNTGAEILYQAKYAYDLNGNRTAAEITQAPDSQGNPQANTRSQVNAYDGLNRLVGTDLGHLIQNAGDYSIDPATLVRTDNWNLDLLGNWSGGSLAGAAAPGRESWGNLDAYGTDYELPNADPTSDTWSLTHQVDAFNQLTHTEVTDLDTSGTIEQHDPVYDAAGNLQFDGNYYFQYDAWNRLVQVNDASVVGGQIELGNLLKHFMYDGLGRLVRTQTPITPGSTNLRTERFYYDGIRRIQELVTNPTVTLGGAQGNSELETLASQSITPGTNPDQQTAPSAYEQGQLLLGGGGGGAVLGTVQREYVWGPGDNGFDELLVQYDQSGDEAWAIQDAGGDLVAMCDLNGDDGQGNSGFARVVGQWTFDAYGEVLTAEYLESFASPHLGHKGLFLARLDGTTGSPRLVPFGHSLYHMRNRTYAPGLGRFLQRDPNATAMALVEATAMHGRGLGALGLAFDMEGLCGDGGNLYEYLGSSPWERSDILGLSWDPFDMVDEYLAEDAGSKAAFIDRAIGFWHTAAYLGAYIASWLPFPPAMILGEIAMAAMGEPDTALWNAVKGAEQELMALADMLGGIHIFAVETAAYYSDRFGSRSVGTAVPGGLTSQGNQLAMFTGMQLVALGGVALAGLPTTDVYVTYRGNNIVYVGNSRDVAARFAQHNTPTRKYPNGRGFTRYSRITSQKVSVLQALAIETAVIERHRATGRLALENKIRSMSPRRAIFGLAMNWAGAWIRQNAPHLW
ncbi:MAG: hypothetical protein IPJ41_17020 [Phycisphaerales bacterium]|nr:hypothetical protein [Phycisphaerales bacterium]